MTTSGDRKGRRARRLCFARLRFTVLAASLVALAAAGEREEIPTLVEQGRHQEALERLEEHLRQNPEDVEARFLQGVALAELGREEDAIDVFSRLGAEHPELAELHNNLAVLHATRGEYEAARVALQAAIEARPEDFRYRENLGDLHAALAAEAYGRAAELGEASGRAAAKRRRIEDLLADPRSDERADAEGNERPSPPAEESECAGAVDAVDAWAAVWASQDIERYLSHYAETFSPAEGLSREGWAAERRRRLTTPGFIEVRVSDLSVEVCAQRRARLTFTQTYRSDDFRDRVRKELWMSRAGEGWQILSERVLDMDRGAPASTPVTRASPSPAASTKTAARVFRIQLGSHRERSQAEQELQGFRKAHPTLLDALPARLQRIDLGAKGVWYRLQFGEFPDPAGARAVCGKLKQRGQDCLVLATRGSGPLPL